MKILYSSPSLSVSRIDTDYYRVQTYDSDGTFTVTQTGITTVGSQ